MLRQATGPMGRQPSGPTARCGRPPTAGAKNGRSTGGRKTTLFGTAAVTAVASGARAFPAFGAIPAVPAFSDKHVVSGLFSNIKKLRPFTSYPDNRASNRRWSRCRIDLGRKRPVVTYDRPLLRSYNFMRMRPTNSLVPTEPRTESVLPTLRRWRK